MRGLRMPDEGVGPPSPERVTWKQHYADDIGDDREDPWTYEAALERLKEVMPHIPIASTTQPQFVESNNNDAWKLDDLFLRVCWRGDRGRFRREAELMASLPSEVPTPEVLAVRAAGKLTWQLSRNVPGRSLSDFCGLPSTKLGRDLMAQFASILRTLHEWSPPQPIVDMLAHRPGQDASDVLAIVGADTVPLPVPRALALVDELKACFRTSMPGWSTPLEERNKIPCRFRHHCYRPGTMSSMATPSWATCWLTVRNLCRPGFRVRSSWAPRTWS